jgi:hypothetical protein
LGQRFGGACGVPRNREELIRVLAYPKFRLDQAERNALLQDYLPFAEAVQLADPPPVLPAVCRDRTIPYSSSLP